MRFEGILTGHIFLLISFAPAILLPHSAQGTDTGNPLLPRGVLGVRADSDADPAGPCHTFNQDLKWGDRGSEVGALHRILVREGRFIEEGGAVPKYDVRTVDAIASFQNRWRREVLNTVGKLETTGYLEGRTRAWFNRLYGCGDVKAPGLRRSFVTILSPNGGEIWKVGGTYTIRWTMHINRDAGDNNLDWDVRLRRLDKTSGRELTPSVSPPGHLDPSGYAYVWTIPPKVPSTHERVIDLTDPNVVYRAWVEVITRVFERGTPDYIKDESDATFTIVSTSDPVQ